MGVDAVHALVYLTASARRQGTSLLLLGLRPIVRRAISLGRGGFAESGSSGCTR